uniref:Uncharacterized protein n=1 Tax=Arundo donax TaxID=35708 RepID=A0A0A9EDJ3_ARUDO
MFPQQEDAILYISYIKKVPSLLCTIISKY